MFKWIGSVLIIVACSGIGFSKSREMQQHLDALEELKKLFCLIRSELQYTRAPFAELFEKIAGKTSAPYEEWLLSLSKKLREKISGPFWEIWCLSVDEALQGSHLKTDELYELKSVGKNPEYTESLDLYIEQLEYKIKNMREVYRSKRKLCQSMGIMGGILLVILLL